MSRPPGDRLLTKPVVAWCAFDFANSSYTTLITTVAFSVYFKEAVVGRGSRDGDLLWGLAGIAVNLLLILTSPVLGAMADFSGRKKRFLLLTVVQTVIATALLALVGPGRTALAMVLYVVASVGFEGGYVFYNAFLPEIAPAGKLGKVSGLAWGAGFVGGLVSLLACIPFLARPLLDGSSGALDPTAVSGYRTAFVVVAAFFALFSIPTFLFLREGPSSQGLPRTLDYVRVGFRRVGTTLSHLRAYRATAIFILAYVCYFGGIATVIRFSAIFASQTFGIRGLELLLLFVFTNIVAVPGTLGAGWLADRIGPRATISLTLVLWSAVALTGAFAAGKPAFWVMAAGAAIGMGSTQAVSRSFLAQLAPPERESEFFGFYVLAGQVGSILAFLTFGLVSRASGDQRLAVLWTLPFFLAGLALNLLVRPRTAS